MTPSGIEPATFRFVAQYLNHCATAVPLMNWVRVTNFDRMWNTQYVMYLQLT
jgi:hypothetical protein